MRLPLSSVRCLSLVVIIASKLLEPSISEAADSFHETVLPFVKTYCFECHNQKTAEGQLDLTRYSTAESVAADYRKWEHVVTFVTREEMPPPDAKQPEPAERAKVLRVLGALMLQEARKTAGDPGVVLPRRLSNAEYNNAIRDLTSVEIRPADSFPIDPASGEGFSNTGEALVMSPSLFKKYYAAAQHVADHVLLTPTAMTFAPHPVVTFADQTKLTEQAILSFYKHHEVDYTKYLTAAWLYRHRPESRRAATIEDWAIDQQLSPKYLRSLWEMLSDEKSDDRFLLGAIRQRFNTLPAPAESREPNADGRNPFPNGNQKKDNGFRPSALGSRPEITALANDIQRLSTYFCLRETEAIVGNAGNGPVQHIDRRKKTAANRNTFSPDAITDNRKLNLPLAKASDKPVTLSLRVSSIGDAARDGYVVLKGLTLTVTTPPESKSKNIPLRTFLSEHLPDELQRLNWGTHPLGQKVDDDSLVLKVPSELTIEIPAKAFGETQPKNVSGEAVLDRANSPAGSALVDVSAKSLDKREAASWSDVTTGSLLINPDHPIAKEFAASGEAFCKLFPNRFYFADETRGLSAGFHLIEGFFRDDQPLCQLVLSEAENRELDRHWDELYFVTGVTEKMLRGFVFFERSERNFMKHPDFDSIKEEDPELTTDATLNRFEQIYLARSGVKSSTEEIATHPIHTFFEEFRTGLRRRSAQWQAAVPIYEQRLQEFAKAAYRRSLTPAEQQKLTQFFREAAKPESLGIDQAVRATVVRILVSPHFCYLADAGAPGEAIRPLPDLALASRLSVFLWSSIPDAELLTLAEAGQLNNDETLRTQTRRMLRSPKVSGFALEFFGQWLNYRDFPKAESVNRTVFPAFDDSLKQAMFEEPTRLAAHLLQNDRPLTELLRSDITFVNKRLAQHYGLPFPENSISRRALAPGSDAPAAQEPDASAFRLMTSPGDANRETDEWQLVSGLHEKGRGGLLGMAVFLTKNSQPQRTSPVKRGFWVVHKLLGEHIPPPPPDVAVLPAKETDTDGKTIRQLLAMHTEDVKCARCHVRFDSIGLAMEGFDSIGRSRSKDLAGRAIDNAVRLPTGEQARGVSEFSEYLAKNRRAEFTRTLNRKLLGYALGRSLQLSDLVLLEKMEATLQETDYRSAPLFEAVVTSPVFRNQRGRDFK